MFRAHERSTRGNAVASQGRTSAKTGYTTSRDAITVETAEWQEDGWREWLLWSEVCAEESPQRVHAGPGTGLGGDAARGRGTHAGLRTGGGAPPVTRRVGRPDAARKSGRHL
ncbi:hypothetical protein GCM10020256_21390 [Streptomyces thermocoprophilus]